MSIPVPQRCFKLCLMEQDDDCCNRPYLSIYSILDQKLSPNGGPLDYAQFQGINDISAPDFDVTGMNAPGQIKFLQAGHYLIAYSVNGRLDSPFPQPVPSWGMSIYINGAQIPGSASAAFSQSPDDDALCVSNNVIIPIAANDILMLRSISKKPILLKGIHTELVVPVAGACLSILKVA